MQDLISFRTMITPMIIIPVYWIITVLVIISGFSVMFTMSFWAGLGTLVFGVIGARIWAEITLVMFRVYDSVKKA